MTLMLGLIMLSEQALLTIVIYFCPLSFISSAIDGSEAFRYYEHTYTEDYFATLTAKNMHRHGASASISFLRAPHGLPFKGRRNTTLLIGQSKTWASKNYHAACA